ncbi:COMM domain-containing protein 5-like [Anoplophora glabripennis]|uniref:COMM domain-containing protein 5-like n=1 Tax=Anoplophora glabripennis TaxID=217634 RepID=UPI000874B853|nr:COMM domain-containing protein 5-like [Anoplophora glabripennis]
MSFHEIPKSVLNTACEFPTEFQSKILKMALVANQPTAQDRSKIIENLSNDSNIPKDRIYEVLGIYIGLIRCFLETSDNEFNAKLLEIGFTPDFVQQLPFIGHREEIVKNLTNNFDVDFGKLSSLKWKIDISLSSALLKKVPTSVILCLVLKNGEKCTIEVDAKSFHKLRFNIALILKELTLIKSNFFK